MGFNSKQTKQAMKRLYFNEIENENENDVSNS